VVDHQRIHDLELAVQRQLLDGKALKMMRTVDYAGGMVSHGASFHFSPSSLLFRIENLSCTVSALRINTPVSGLVKGQATLALARRFDDEPSLPNRHLSSWSRFSLCFPLLFLFSLADRSALISIIALPRPTPSLARSR